MIYSFYLFFASLQLSSAEFCGIVLILTKIMDLPTGCFGLYFISNLCATFYVASCKSTLIAFCGLFYRIFSFGLQLHFFMDLQFNTYKASHISFLISYKILILLQLCLPATEQCSSFFQCCVTAVLFFLTSTQAICQIWYT